MGVNGTSVSVFWLFMFPFLGKLCLIHKKLELPDQVIHRLTFCKTTCNSGFLLPIAEQRVVWLILYGCNSRSFGVLWAVDFHIPLSTLNWCKDFLGLLSIWMPVSSNIFILPFVQQWTCLLDIPLCFHIISKNQQHSCIFGSFYSNMFWP